MVHDITLTKNSGLLDVVPPREKGLADKGYEGLDPVTFLVMLKALKVGQGEFVNIPSFTMQEHEYNRALSSQIIEIERVNGWLQRFAVLEDFRMRDRLFHRVLCNVVNIWMELAPMRRHVHPLLMDCRVTKSGPNCQQSKSVSHHASQGRMTSLA